jgi:hypothetical protein
MGGCDGAPLQVCDLGWGEVVGSVCCRHVSEAIGCANRWQVMPD